MRTRSWVLAAIVLAVATASASGRGRPVDAAAEAPCAAPDAVLPVGSSFSFAAIGDFGDFAPTGRVAGLISSWQPAFVATLGDNSYNPDATSNGIGGFVFAGSKIDRGVGQWFWPWIGAYRGEFGTGPAPDRPNRFFRVLGNHDWDAVPGGAVFGALADARYYTLPGNERYYSVLAGEVQLFVIDADPRSLGATGGRYEPDGVSVDSVQAQWLRAHLADSTARWKIVLFHFPPYTSAPRGGTTVLRWPFAEWGASLVITGHEHQYERLTGPDGLPYVVAGHGGNVLTTTFPNAPSPAVSNVRVGGQFGAVRFDATATTLTLSAYGQPQATPAAPFAVIDQLTVPVAPVQPVRAVCILRIAAAATSDVSAQRLGPVDTP